MFFLIDHKLNCPSGLHAFQIMCVYCIFQLVSKGEQRSEGSEGEEEEIKHQHEDNQFLELESEDDAGSDTLNKMRRLLEREWSRREAVMELFYKRVYGGE